MPLGLSLRGMSNSPTNLELAKAAAAITTALCAFADLIQRLSDEEWEAKVSNDHLAEEAETYADKCEATADAQECLDRFKELCTWHDQTFGRCKQFALEAVKQYEIAKKASEGGVAETT